MSTLADVAALATVSKSTASRALSRPDLVAPETAARVRAAAEQLGFVPSRVASQLARGRTGIVALVVPTLDNTFFTPIISGAQARADLADLQLTVSVNPMEEPAQLRAFERLTRQVDGVIVVAPRGADELLQAAGALRPTVLVDRELAGMSSIVADTATAFGTLMRRFIADGHRSVAYIGGPEGSWQDRQRTRAVTEAAQGRAGLTVLGPAPSTFAAGVSSVEAVLACGATAVVPYATSIGLGLVFGLHARGIASPGDVIVSTERMVAEALGSGTIPAIDVDGEGLGTAAMAALADALESKGAPGAPVRRRLSVPVFWPGA
ncbi:LacI family DNA-binding transcriptional regulator [Streptomyces shenzhenensis]|uniref:LacI family DNA-binding transcriptional regulator n=2 Tax=Streptomyces shenzhenensis TaxID=943815 RepID=UPI00368C8468